MNRRELLLQSVSTIGLTAIGLNAISATASDLGGTNEKLINSSMECTKVSLICVNHCQKELAKGNKEMAECLQSVLEVIASCESLQKMASYDSVFTKDFAKITAKVCANCGKICEKHSQHMAICKACMNACKECEKVCLAA